MASLLIPGDIVRLRTGDSDIKITKVYEDLTVDGAYVKSFHTISKRHQSHFSLVYRADSKSHERAKINYELTKLREHEEYYCCEKRPMLDDIVRLKNGTANLKVIKVTEGLVTARYVSSLGYDTPLENSIVTKHYDCFVLVNRETTTNKNSKESIMTNIQKQATEIGQSVLNDHENIAKITVGRVLYENIRNVAKGYIKLSWFQKLFMSKSSIELIELTAVYGVLKLVQNKYDHYLIECVSLYLASELQHNLLSSIPLDIENLLKPVIKK